MMKDFGFRIYRSGIVHPNRAEGELDEVKSEIHQKLTRQIMRPKPPRNRIQPGNTAIYVALGLAVGAGIGAAAGAAFSNLPLWLSIGVGIGLALGAGIGLVLDTTRKGKGDN